MGRCEMTAVIEPDNTVMVANAADLQSAVENALRRARCSFEDLAHQAASGNFDSIQARLAWVAIGDLYGVDLDRTF
jgi:hypothetical protein